MYKYLYVHMYIYITRSALLGAPWGEGACAILRCPNKHLKGTLTICYVRDLGGRITLTILNDLQIRSVESKIHIISFIICHQMFFQLKYFQVPIMGTTKVIIYLCDMDVKKPFFINICMYLCIGICMCICIFICIYIFNNAHGACIIQVGGTEEVCRG